MSTFPESSVSSESSALAPEPATRPFSLRDYLPSLGIGVRRAVLGSILPVATFYVLLTRVNLTVAVIVAALWALTVFALRWQRSRHLDLFSGVTLVFIGLQTAVGLVFQSTQAYLATPALEGFVWFLIMLGSVIVRRPLIGALARQFIPLPAWIIGTPPYLRAFSLPTVLWGLVLAGRALVRLMLLTSLSLEHFLIAVTLMSWITSLMLLAFSIWYPNRVLRPYLRGERPL